MKRLPYILILIELVLLILVPVAAWVASVLGCDVANPVSEEGIRWMFNHGAKSLVSLQLSYLILLLSALGAIQDCGILVDMKERSARGRTMWLCLGFFLVMLFILIFPVFLPHNGLLGVTGGIVPSPWLTGFPLAFFVIVIFCCLLYAAMRSRLDGLMGIPRFLSSGILRYGMWIVVAMIGTLIVRMIRYFIFV